MEDGYNTLAPISVHPGPMINGEVGLSMANSSPEAPEQPEVNGSSDIDKIAEEESSSSDSSDTLVIDESKPRVKPNGKRVKRKRFCSVKRPKTFPQENSNSNSNSGDLVITNAGEESDGNINTLKEESDESNVKSEDLIIDSDELDTKDDVSNIINSEVENSEESILVKPSNDSEKVEIKVEENGDDYEVTTEEKTHTETDNLLNSDESIKLNIKNEEKDDESIDKCGIESNVGVDSVDDDELNSVNTNIAESDNVSIANKDINIEDSNTCNDNESNDVVESDNEASNFEDKSNSITISSNPNKLQKTLLQKKVKKKSPQLQEYAQYLGLQPTVQFKCVKCKCAGFETLSSLNEHSMQCTATGPVIEQSTSKTATTQFKIQRRVFLCSVCGTYYENWNLFLHMREVHKRFTCLYCLGMFSQPEKLCSHLISKHNCTIGNLETLEDFFNKYTEPCFLMCCDCQKVFNEQDNFFNHDCVDNANNSTKMPAQITTTDIESNSNQTFANNEESNLDPVGDDSNLSNNPPSLEEKIVPSIADNNCEKVDEKSTQEEETSVKLETIKEENEDEVQESIGEEDVQEDENVNEAIENEHDNDVDKDLSVEQEEKPEPQEEVRKVPKLSLKLSNFTPYNSGDEKDHDDQQDSDASEGLVMEVDNVESETEDIQTEEQQQQEVAEEKPLEQEAEQTLQTNSLQVAGPDIPIIELELEQPLDKFEIRVLIQRCLNATVSMCIYCNHARKIAVNGKQLGLHAIAEHRFSAIVNSITAEELIPESFNSRIKDSLHELENVYFNLETSSPEEAITFSHVFECFQCRYSTTVHKELYLHNRKMHAKTILLCIMCKSNFYSYSELVCHLCPGLYVLDSEVRFRCCMCVSDDLPSAFRLMVHLRKRHHACDVCLELCNNQSRLSNHVWKHKLHHFCYRCGIAYRNKPDITKHLFWKHGTESVLCKRCLQKKWPHVYHFCIPPPSFTCEECNLSFSRAVSLMVHKRLHTEERPHSCTFEDCTEKFISKKLLLKHEFKHREPIEDVSQSTNQVDSKVEEDIEVDVEKEKEPVKEEEAEKPQIIQKDIYDLPELNLSESDSSDSENETPPAPKPETIATNILEETPVLSNIDETDEVKNELGSNETNESVPIIENIWDNFKNYQASKEKSDTLTAEPEKIEILEDIPRHYEPAELLEFINKDHDYCGTQDEIKEIVQDEKIEDKNVDHDYCTGNKTEEKSKEEAATKTAEKKDSSDSSSDSDSSSCTCGSNCSCSSSSGSTSSSSESSGSDSSTSEGRRKKLQRKEQRKQLKNKAKEQAKAAPEPKPQPEVKETPMPAVPAVEIVIQESDLETTETDTDEDFYDEHPQRLAKQLQEEKRNKMAQVQTGVEPVNGTFIETSRPSTPSLPEELKPKKKSKNKKRKKKKSQKYSDEAQPNIPINNNQVNEAPVVSPFSVFARQSPVVNPHYGSPREGNVLHQASIPSSGINHKQQSDTDSNLRASKRRRVPNKFYGYSSDEDREKVQSPSVLKWRKLDYQQPPPMVVPPLTIKTVPSVQKQVVEPISIRTSTNTGEFRIQNLQARNQMHNRAFSNNEAPSESNDSSSEEDEENNVPPPPPPPPPAKEQTQLYCYCRCPYDEVSEMIGCDSKNCAIEWFHFECVGIMVPPKGQWYCPDCRKKKQQRRDIQAQ